MVWGNAADVSSPSGVGAEPQSKSNLMHFSLKMWHKIITKKSPQNWFARVRHQHTTATDRHGTPTVEADRISFSFFGARKRIFFGVLFFGQKRHLHFRFFSFSVLKWPLKKQKRKSVLWLRQCTAGRTLKSPAVAYSRCLHRYLQRH